MASVDVETLWTRLRRRKVVQWGIAYAAGAWGLLQGLGYVSDAFHWPDSLKAVATLALLVGLPIVLVLAWYHGDRGQQKVTGAELLIIALLFLIGGGIFWRYERGASPGPASSATASTAREAAGGGKPPADVPRESIAVLPFVNMSKDAENEYFSDGISEEILNSLAQMPGLKVAARTSSFSFKGEKREVPEIAQELKVRMVLEGSVRKQGERVRITAQLIDAANGFHVWSQTYDRDLKDIFAIQDEIAHAIAGELKVKLAPGHAAQGERPATTDLEAYDLYLQGLSLWQARGQDNLKKADALFKEAVARDPKFAKGWAGIALVATLGPDWFGMPVTESTLATRNAAERALALNPALPEAYAALGNSAFNDGRWDTGRALLERAIAIAPSYATAWQWLGIGLSLCDPTGAGIPIARKAVELDPLSSVARQDLAGGLYRMARYDEALAVTATTVTDPRVRTSSLFITFDSQVAKKDYEAARASARALAESRGPASLEFVDRVIDALEGKTDPAPIAKFLVTAPDGFVDTTAVSPFTESDIFAWFMAAGRHEEAMTRLRALAARDAYYTRQEIVDPVLDAIRCRPDFREIVEQVESGDPRAAMVCGKGLAAEQKAP